MMMVTTTTMMMKIPKLVAISTKMIRRMMITYIFTSENSLHDFMKAESNNEYKIPSSFQTLKKCTAWYPIKISLRLIRVTFFKGTR